MKTKKIRSALTLLLAISLIVASTLGVQMQSGYATGVSGSYNPSLSCTVTNLNGSSLWATANNFTLDNTYPRLVTNGYQLKVSFSGYDTTGISNINIKLIKAVESNQLYSWRQPGFPGLVWDKNFSAQNSTTYDYVFYVTNPGTYVVLTTITAGNGRKTEDIDYFLYGGGPVVAGDFNNRIGRPEGQALFCTLYDLGGTGINKAATSLYVAKSGTSYWPSNSGLTITQDPTFQWRYKVSGYGIRPAELERIQGQYIPVMFVKSNDSSTSIFSFPPYN